MQRFSCCRVSQKCVMDRIISSTYSSVSRFLLERDKNIYRLLLAIEVSLQSPRSEQTNSLHAGLPIVRFTVQIPTSAQL